MKFAFRCLLFPCLLAAHTSFAQDILIAVKKDGKWGYVNTSGASVIAGRFDEAYPFYNDKAVAVEKKQYGLIDPKGAWLVPPRKGTTLGEINSNRVVCSNE